MKRNIISIILISGLVLALGCGKSDANKPASNNTSTPAVHAQTTAPDGKAIDFTLMSIDGTPVSLKDYVGKVVILNFWATWCPPCRMEIPHFNDLVKQYGDKGLAVLGVSVDKDAVAAVTKFKQDNPVHYTVVIDDGQIADRYQLVLPPEERGGIPFTFLIDKQGNIRKTFVGYRDKAVWEAEIKPLL